MKREIFKGAGVALVTPMKEDGSVNYETLEKLIEFQISNKTDAIIVCGTTGESATLSEQERNDVIKFTVDRVSHRVPVIAGTGGNNTSSVLKSSQDAEKLGVDGLLIVTPFYNKTSQQGLIEHYSYVSDRVHTPIIMYNVPSRTGLNMSPETCEILSRKENICAIKEASGNISAVAKIISLCGDDFGVYSGNDDQIVPVLSLGGIGVISVFSNVCPKECHDITEKYFKGENKVAAKMQLKYLELMNMMFCDTSPVPVKEAMNLMGFNCGKCRMPLYKLSDENFQKLKLVMKDYELIKIVEGKCGSFYKRVAD